MFEHCGWYGSVENFLETPDSLLLTRLKAHAIERLKLPVDSSQITAWKDCYHILQKQCQLFDGTVDRIRWTLIFEYELPRERGRRPDVVLLDGGFVYVLEFKGFPFANQSHIDQVSAYARDLKYYHEESHPYTIIPILVLTKTSNYITKEGKVTVCSPNCISECFQLDLSNSEIGFIDSKKWLDSEYAPLPSLVSAARQIFQHESLPQIKKAQSAGIPNTIEKLVNIAKQAKEKNEFHCAFVTGVPGSGKTLVGLQFVYSNIFDESDTERRAVFLSGNGPLVRVLQHALKSSVFVQDVHGFLKQYGGEETALPKEHIWVYDEAQRAWDADRVLEKRGHYHSEPMDFLLIGERMGSWAMIVGLIGEGQEIHIGEEAGIAQWNDAIRSSTQPWHVHCSEKIAEQFTEAATITTSNHLDLNITLRSHLADHLHTWIASLLMGSIEEAAILGKEVADQGFDLYITRDIELAKQYVRERYHDQTEKRYGLIASSKAKNLPNYGVNNGFSFTKRVREGPWYNDEPTSKYSCCQLHDVVTEFSCQGLELDLPIVCWGDDLFWDGDCWRSRPTRRSKAKDPHQLRLNSYRVLLTRGRDGMIVFVPDEQSLTPTFDILRRAGFHTLESEEQKS